MLIRPKSHFIMLCYNVYVDPTKNSISKQLLIRPTSLFHNKYVDSTKKFFHDIPEKVNLASNKESSDHPEDKYERLEKL